MAGSKSYFQIMMQQVGKFTNAVMNSISSICSIFSWSSENAVQHNTQKRTQVRSTNTTPRSMANTPFLTTELIRDIVQGYRRGIARHVCHSHYPGINIFPTILDKEQEDLRKLERDAAKAEKDMIVSSLTIARLQIDHLISRQKELESQVTQLKQPEFDSEKFSYDLICEEEPPETLASPVISPRTLKSKIPKPIPIKPKKQNAQQSPKTKLGY